MERVYKCVGGSLFSFLPKVRLPLLLVSCLAMSGCVSPYVRHSVQSRVVRQNYHDRTLFLYSSDQLMHQVSVEFRDTYIEDLMPALRFAQRYPKLHMRVSVFGDDAFVSTEDRNLAQFRADVIASYFWSEGIDASRISYVGHAMGAHSVSSNRTPLGSEENRRVEIAFFERV